MSCPLNCRNVGVVDRIARLVLGIAGVFLAFTRFDVMNATPLGFALAAFGAIMLLTAAIGTCPLYIPLKLTTCRAKPE
ncbi:MAG: DUF2892 domain-containing protein [Phycisphaerales bacterium]